MIYCLLFASWQTLIRHLLSCKNIWEDNKMIQILYEAANLCNIFFAILFLCINLTFLKLQFFISKITLYKLKIIIALVIFFSFFFNIIYCIMKKDYVQLFIIILLELEWIMIIRNNFKSLWKEKEKI